MDRAVERTARQLHTSMAIYRGLLRLYPHAFRRTYGDELEADFEEAARETLGAAAPFALARLWCFTILDLLRSLCREWLHTPWLLVLPAAASAAGVVFYATMGRFWLAAASGHAAGPSEFARRRGIHFAQERPDSPELFLLVAMMVLVPVAAVFALWAISRLAQLRATGPEHRA